MDDLPASGWLYFFLGIDEPAYEVAHQVLYFGGARDTLAPASPPAGTRPMESEIDFAAHEVRFRPSFVFDDALEETLELEQFALEFLTATATQIAGLPVSWDHDPREDAHLLRGGFTPLLFRTHRTPEQIEKQAVDAWADADEVRGEALEHAAEMLRAFQADEAAQRAQMESWRVLFLLESHREVGMCWWDAGLLQFLIRDEDLRRRRFDRTYCCVASS